MTAAMLASPVQAAVGAPRSIIVSPNDNIVLIDGLVDTTSYTVSVTRGGVTVGEVTAVPQDFGVAGALEINHAAAPTLCWGGVTTPDILPGDVVSLTGAGIAPTDTVAVAGITTTGATGNPQNNAFTITGTLAPGLDPANLDVFVRLLLPADWRANATDAGNSLDVVGGNWTATFNTGESGGVATPVNAAIVDAAETDPRVLEANYADGGALNAITTVGPDAGDPQPGECPPVGSHAISSVSPSVINASNPNDGITVQGLSAGAGQTVAVTLSDGVDSLVDNPAVNPNGTWTASFPGPLTAFDGALTVTAAHTPVPGAAAQNTRTVLRDVVAPAEPTISPNGGAFPGTVAAFLNSPSGDQLRYTVGNGLQAAPTSTSGSVFTGGINLTPPQTVKAIAVDAAGNASTVLIRSFTRSAAGGGGGGGGGAAIIPNSPRIGEADAGRRGGNRTAKARWNDPVANGAVLDGFRVRAVQIRSGRDKVMDVVRVGADRNRVSMSLPRGQYKFQVRAFNAAGKSDWSERSNKVRAR